MVHKYGASNVSMAAKSIIDTLCPNEVLYGLYKFSVLIVAQARMHSSVIINNVIMLSKS